MRRVLFLTLSLFCYAVMGQQTLWQPHATEQQRTPHSLWSNFDNFQVELNAEELKTALPSSQVRFKSFPLPLPDGSFNSFTIQETSLLHPSLQAKYPYLRAFKGVNDKGEPIRLNVDNDGIHAIAFTEKGTIYLDAKDDSHISYYARDFKRHASKEVFEESMPTLAKANTATPFTLKRQHAQSRSSGAEMRSYRIAISADYDYTEFHGGTVEGALAAIVTTMNRVTGIYENDAAITFQIVANNDLLIVTNSASDPFDSLSNLQAIDKNQEVIDDIIGDDNYDIGHIFSTGASGLAGLGVVCMSNSKARGITGLNTPQGDPFDVDFVSHEIGHQFNATHTWNGDAGQCSTANRTESTAVEPGSGSTIVAYAGICSDDNLQNNSDPYFHAVSLEQMLTYVEEGTGSTCPEVSATGNTPPVVTTDTTTQFVIPISTPFKLSASASDTDGDGVTLTWEQTDTGPAGSPTSPTGTAPLFRSFAPSTSGERYFPSLSTVLGDGSVKGEVLPTSSRELNFRVTARDNNDSGGGTNSADVTLGVTEEAGPFQVLSQVNADTIRGGSVILVEWDVASTNEDPVNCQFVRISLSEDGGDNFTQTLVEQTHNDGSEYVLFSNRPSQDARIMISAIGNVFYNINETSLIIEEQTEPNFDLLIRETPGVTCGDTLEYQVELITNNGFDDAVTLDLTNIPEGTSAQLQQTVLNPGEDATLRIVNTGDPGERRIAVSGSAAGTSKELGFDVEFLETPDASPFLISPSDAETAVELSPEFSWSDLSNVDTYTLELATDDQFINKTINESELTNTSFAVTEELETKTTYFWRVSGSNTCGSGPLATGKFITSNLGRTIFRAEGLPKPIEDVSTTTSVITIDTDIEVSDIDVLDLDISHTFIGDISMTLTSPEGSIVSILERICQGSDNMYVSLDDEADEADIPCPPTDSLTYQPDNLLTAFDTESAQGDWTLRVTDNFAGDFGTLNGWGLGISSLADAIWLFAEASLPGEIDLNWTNLETNNGYEVEISVDNGAFEALTNLNADITDLTVTGLSPSTSYAFQVRAIVADTVSEYSNVAPITSLPEVPDPPSDLEGLQNPGTVTLLWTDNDDIEEGFVVERAEDDSEVFEEIARTARNVTNYTDETVERGVDYAYQVRAFNISGNSDPAGPLVLAVLNVDEALPDEYLYPNPSVLSIQVPEEALRGATHLVLTDLQGRKLRQEPIITPSTAMVDISQLAKGLYFLQIHDGKELLQVQKFYKE